MCQISVGIFMLFVVRWTTVPVASIAVSRNKRQSCQPLTVANTTTKPKITRTIVKPMIQLRDNGNTAAINIMATMIARRATDPQGSDSSLGSVLFRIFSRSTISAVDLLPGVGNSVDGYDYFNRTNPLKPASTFVVCECHRHGNRGGGRVRDYLPLHCPQQRGVHEKSTAAEHPTKEPSSPSRVEQEERRACADIGIPWQPGNDARQWRRRGTVRTVVGSLFQAYQWLPDERRQVR